jgi:hypothetical protein
MSYFYMYTELSVYSSVPYNMYSIPNNFQQFFYMQETNKLSNHFTQLL